MRAYEFINEDSRDALAFATRAHQHQTRAGGDPYISHPVRVANAIKQYKKSHNLDALISAAYLHDTLEDTDTTHEALHDLFGGLVASLVKELTSDPDEIKRMGKAAYLSQKMATMSSWALVIKLADRLDNVKDITTAKTPEWRQKYRQETEQILNYIQEKRALSNTHKKLISLIRDRLSEIPTQENVAESSENDYLSQIPKLTWKPVNRRIWNTIQDEGLDEEQERHKHTDWVMASLTISEKDSQALKAFDDNAIEDFNRFDIHLKSRYPGLTDLIDYGKGTVTIVKSVKGQQGVAESKWIKPKFNTDTVVYNGPKEKGISIFSAGYFPNINTAWIEAIKSDEPGAGKNMVRSFEQWAKSQGAETINAEALVSSLDFWKKMGFSVAGKPTKKNRIPIQKNISQQSVAEGLDQGIPPVLYHATYRPLLRSIKQNGLGGKGSERKKWSDSAQGVVYLATTPEVAESYAETSDEVSDDWLDEIVILKVRTANLDSTKFQLDRNVQDNTGDTVEYHGVIPATELST